MHSKKPGAELAAQRDAIEQAAVHEAVSSGPFQPELAITDADSERASRSAPFAQNIEMSCKIHSKFMGNFVASEWVFAQRQDKSRRD
jgi:hypothetical protein